MPTLIRILATIVTIIALWLTLFMVPLAYQVGIARGDYQRGDQDAKTATIVMMVVTAAATGAPSVALWTWGNRLATRRREQQVAKDAAIFAAAVAKATNVKL